MTRAEILQQVQQIVCVDREQQYGKPENNFSTIGELWVAYLKCKCVSPGADICIDPDDVAILLALVKVARIASGQVKPDNYIDLAGYASCAGEIATKERNA